MRVGVLRAFIAVLWAALLVLPVGVDGPEGPVSVSIPDALGELARGRLGVGVLEALVAGGEVASAAVVRLVLILLASLAFWLAGRIRSRPEPPPPPKRRRCPYCEAWMSSSMSDCPACGKPVYR